MFEYEEDYLRVPNPFAAISCEIARLACLIHAASVHSEPGSNSPNNLAFYKLGLKIESDNNCQRTKKFTSEVRNSVSMHQQLVYWSSIRLPFKFLMSRKYFNYFFKSCKMLSLHIFWRSCDDGIALLTTPKEVAKFTLAGKSLPHNIWEVSVTSIAPNKDAVDLDPLISKYKFLK